MTDKISESLGLTPIEEFREGEVLDAEEEEITDHSQENSIEDYDYVRKNIKEVIGTASEGLGMLAQLAEASENPKVYETLSVFMRSVLDANKELIELDSKRNVRFKNEANPTSTNNTTNIMMAGTTSDLKKLVDQMRQKDKDKND